MFVCVRVLVCVFWCVLPCVKIQKMITDFIEEEKNLAIGERQVVVAFRQIGRIRSECEC